MTHTTLDYAALIREQGFRLTTQRQVILDVICDLGGHVTPDVIFDEVRRRHPGLNRATVYRNLDFLCEMRLVVAARVGRATHYEIARAEPHHHLICRKCNTLFTMPHTAVQQLAKQVEREHGFVVDMDHLALYGLCAACRSGA